MIKFYFQNIKNGDITIITAKTLLTAVRLFETRYPADVANCQLVEAKQTISVGINLDVDLTKQLN